MADSTISNENISATLPEGADIDLSSTVKGVNKVTIKEALEGASFEKGDGRSAIIGEALKASDVVVNAAKGESSVIGLRTSSFVGNTIKNEGKGSLTIKAQKGNIKNLVVDAGENLNRADKIAFKNDAKVTNGDFSLGKGDDTVRFSKATKIKGDVAIDLGKGGADKVVVAANKVKSGNLTITSFSKKDKLTVGGETFTHKDIKNGAEIPGIKVDLA